MARMPADELVLWTAYRTTKSIEDRNRLVERYLPVRDKIAHIAAQRVPPWSGMTVDDLAADATFGLLAAIESFDINRSVKFATYANLRIWGAIKDGLRKMDWVPRVERKKLKRTGGEPIGIRSINAIEKDDHGDLKELGQGFTYAIEHGNDWWKAACRGCTKIERQVIELYWRQGLSMKQIGQQMGCSESRVSQIHSEALGRIQARGSILQEVL